MTTICGVAAATFKDPTPENVWGKKLTFVCDLGVSVSVSALFFSVELQNYSNGT